MSHRNFDDFIRERNKEHPSFTMFGETYNLPPTIPYAAVLQFRNLSKRGKKEQVSDMEVLDIFKALFGEDTLNSLKSHIEFDLDLAVELMQWSLKAYGVTRDTEEDTNPKAGK